MIPKTIAAALLAALTVNAAPRAHRNPAQDVTQTLNATQVIDGTQTIDGTIYAGAAHFGEDLTEISADITVPECSLGQPFGPYTTYESDGWVGMGAYSGEKYGLIQTGITCYTLNGTAPIYKIWTEWYPALQTFYNDTDIQPGDVISARVVAYSKNSGTTYLHNKRTGNKFSTNYVNQAHQLDFKDVEWVVESRLYLTILGPEGHLDAKYTPWQFHNAEYVIKEGKKHHEKKHKFELESGSHMLDTIVGGYKIAEGIYDKPGHIQVNDTTPTNYTIPGFYG